MEEINEFFENNKIYTLCFTGHRPHKLPWGFNEQDPRCIEMRNNAKTEIEKAIQRGYNTFLCGMALGFDMICAEIVLELKKIYPDIKLIGALPCKTQTKLWSDKSFIERYNRILKQVDGTRCIYDEYVKGCEIERNQYMINNSSLVIALYNGMGGGTKSTINYAEKQGKEVIVIKP